MNTESITAQPYTPPSRLSAITLPATRAITLSRALTIEGIWHGVDPESDDKATVFFKSEAEPHVSTVLTALPSSAPAAIPFWASPVASMAIGVVDSLTHEINQMKGLFGDEDGNIAQALESADEIAEVLELVKAHCGAQSTQDIQPAAIALLGVFPELAYAPKAHDSATFVPLVTSGYAKIDDSGHCHLTTIGETAAALAKISHPGLFEARDVES